MKEQRFETLLLQTVQLLSGKVQRGPALQDEKQAQGLPREKKLRPVLTLLAASLPSA